MIRIELNFLLCAQIIVYLNNKLRIARVNCGEHNNIVFRRIMNIHPHCPTKLLTLFEPIASKLYR